MAEAALSTDYEEQEPETCCGYCMRPVEEMDQPKTLPCGHISCLPCVREDFHKLNGSIMCEKCKSIMGDIVLYALPDHKVILEGFNAPTSTTEDHASQVRTTRCDACDKPANAYCLDCDKRMCIEHILPHDHFVEKVLNTKHEKIRAEDYEQYPGLYESPFCKEHPAHRLIEVCTLCNELFCTRCDPRVVCKNSSTRMGVRKFHVLKEVAVFTNICTERLKSLTKKLSDTEDVFAQAEKKCWAKLDSLEERMQSLKMEVKVKVEELVRQIQEQGETIEEELTECLNVNTHAVEEKAERLRNEREQLTAARTSLSDFTNHSREVHIIRNVQYRVGDTEKLLAGSTEASKDVKLFSLFLSCGELGDMLKTSPQPHRLELLNTESYKALSAEWIRSDRIGCISENKFLCAVMNEKLAVISADTLDNMGKIKSSIAVERQIKVPDKDGYILTLWLKPMLHDDPSPLKTAFWMSEEKIRHFAGIGALYDRICTLSSADDSTVKLTVCSLATNEHFGVRLAGITSYWGLHMISRSEVIVSDETNGKLYKYSIPNRNPVWILDGFNSPVDITSDSAGLIYVASQNAKKIYVVNSSTGQLMTELTHPDLNKVATINTISVSGNKLVTACGDSGILLFDIK